MADLIDRVALGIGRANPLVFDKVEYAHGWNCAVEIVEKAPAADAVEVEVLKAWLYEIAMNNTNNYLGDACEVIISRLDGLRVFARERRTDADNRC